jgi:hypothetical protein
VEFCGIHGSVFKSARQAGYFIMTMMANKGTHPPQNDSLRLLEDIIVCLHICQSEPPRNPPHEKTLHPFQRQKIASGINKLNYF